MIAVDTNVLLRYFAQDDPVQSRTAAEFIERRLSEKYPAFVSAVVLVELVWTLRRLERASRSEIVKVLNVLLSSKVFVLEHRKAVATAMAAFDDDGFDFADVFIHLIAKSYGSEATYTFDRKASNYPGFRLL